LQLYQASYVVYGRHSEAEIADKWTSITDLEKYLEDFKQHSLRNPIVEQIVTETLRVVRDIWKHYGQSANDFFDEIHIELGREMKNTAEDRKYLSEQVSNNEATNLRIKALLMELKENSDGKLSVEDVRPYSPMQQDALRIYEEGVLNSNIEFPEDILKISKTAQPSTSELQRYKLWLEQKYRSPYTGQIIPLGKLFTEEYQIEHVIPKSRYFDDSFNNKVICESAVNQLKDKLLGLEFIQKYYGQEVELGLNKTVRIFTVNDYKDFVKQHYTKNNAKRRNLLLDDIPEQMIARQMNDTRYVSKFISALLSNIVRAEKDDDGINSKNLIPGNGKITTTLKQDWGLNDVWNDLILPRFIRMNELTQTSNFTSKNQEGHTIPTIPFELSKGFQKKRIDHRHHAMDALVIACMTRDHVNLLNNQSAKSEVSRYDLQNKLRNKEKESWFDKKENMQIERDVFKDFKKPWENFTVDAKHKLETIVVSFKQNQRVINKATNKYEKYKDGKKVKVEQEGINWAIRKPMHEQTVSGLVNLSWIKLKNDEITTATRKVLDKSFDDEKIKKITDTGIQKILLNYLKTKGNNSEVAFSPEGIEDLNRNISQYNDNKSHLPIFKVRVYEKGSGRFILGEQGNKRSKYVQGSPNLFFAIYTNEQQHCKGADKKPTKRCFETIPLNIVIERLKQRLNPVPETNQIGEKLLFYLTPGDLIYVPSEEDNLTSIDFNNLTEEQKKRLYNVNDFSSSTCYFTPNRIAKAIMGKEVDLSFDKKRDKLTGSFDTKTASLEGVQIKEICIPIKVDRLGKVVSIDRKNI